MSFQYSDSIHPRAEVSKLNEDDSVHDATEKVDRIMTSGEQGQYVHLGGKRYLKSDLMYTFGGTFNPGVNPVPHIKLANPSPMGLFGFATTNLILSFINAGARGVSNSNIMLSCAIFYGGVIQIIAACWEMVVENTFGATVFTTFGGYWIAYGTLSANGFNIISSYDSAEELANAKGLFLLAFSICAFFFLLCSVRSTIPFFSLFFFNLMTLILLVGSEFAAGNGKTTVSGHLGTAGGVFGCITAMLAYYCGVAGMMNRENSWINVKPIYMPGAIRPPLSNKTLEE